MQNIKGSPIGFFDSGYGGLTVLKEVQKALPQYDYVYIGDNYRAPYGTKRSEMVYKYTWEGILCLFEQGCDLIILACNTASAKALRRIQQNDLLAYPEKRVLGVIRPSAEVVGAFSNSNHITILGTQGTVASKTYLKEFKVHSPQTIVHQYACPKWVPIIENQTYKTEVGKQIILEDVQKIIHQFPLSDVILLGCTHYPILQVMIQQVVGIKVQVISQGEIVAQSLVDYLKRHQWLENKLGKGSTTVFYSSGNPLSFKKHASSIIAIEIDEVRQIKIGK